MIDHFTLSVKDMAISRAFYERALAPLGYAVRMDFKEYVGFGDKRKPYFWLKQSPNPTQPMHIAFQASDRAAVNAFHSAAVGAGAKDNGAPGIRNHYHANYYGAFVIDPDGHPIEAVCHAPAKAAKRAAKAKVGGRKKRK